LFRPLQVCIPAMLLLLLLLLHRCADIPGWGAGLVNADPWDEFSNLVQGCVPCGLTGANTISPGDGSSSTCIACTNFGSTPVAPGSTECNNSTYTGIW
jgi:hypothetical protein